MLAIQLHQTKCQDTRKRRCNTSDQIEDRESLLDVICSLESAQISPPFQVLHIHRVYQQESRYTHPGKYPASKTPSKTRSPTSCPKSFAKPVPWELGQQGRYSLHQHHNQQKIVHTIKITAQVIIIVDRKIVGPIFRIKIVIGGWKRTYGTKNINTAIDCHKNLGVRTLSIRWQVGWNGIHT